MCFFHLFCAVFFAFSSLFPLESHSAFGASMDPKVWQVGAVDQALAKAKKEQRPILLYWGAVWCPPCNELKQQVFSQARFKELAKSFLPVFIDGDSENAQAYAERFQVKGYPTVVLLDANANELTRISGNLTMDEFEQMLRSFLASGASLKDLVSKATKGQLSDAEWAQLSYVSWDQLHLSDWSPAQKLEIQKDLADQAPDRLPAVKASLTAALLASAARMHDSTDSQVKTPLAQIQVQFPDYLKKLQRDGSTMIAARSFYLYSLQSVLDWNFQGRASSPVFQEFKRDWLAAVRTIRAQKSLSLDTRLWTYYPELQLVQFEAGGNKDQVKFPLDLKAKVQAAVRSADKQAKSNYQRHAVISGAAYLLRYLGDFEGARDLLIKELRKTDTPWYYQSSLASLEKAAGRKPQALYWSGKASASAKGRASKLQWIASDIQMTASLDPNGQIPRLQKLLREFYGLALALPDGFSGRNESRAKRVQQAVKPLLGKKPIRQTLQQYASQCRTAAATAQCNQHFSGLLGS